MATGIIITGPSGSGKTTLGKMTAESLGYTFADIDDYIWKKDTEIPFSVMYSKEEKIHRLMDAISHSQHFVMAGSMDSFHRHFDPFFELAVYLYADTRLRVKRVHERELQVFGKRILEDGDMYEQHCNFLKDIAGYDFGLGGCTAQGHERWLESLKCTVLRLDGSEKLEKNRNRILDRYR